MPSFLRLKSASADAKQFESKEGPAKSIINIFLPGGMSGQETFDPKPYAPLEYRGEMRSIGTKLDGAQFGELLKQTAQVADKITVLRRGRLVANKATRDSSPEEVTGLITGAIEAA